MINGMRITIYYKLINFENYLRQYKFILISHTHSTQFSRTQYAARQAIARPNVQNTGTKCQIINMFHLAP